MKEEIEAKIIKKINLYTEKLELINQEERLRFL